MSVDLILHASKCVHDVWHPHDSIVLDDDSIIDDPEGACAGGTIAVDGVGVFGISHFLAKFLRDVEGSQ